MGSPHEWSPLGRKEKVTEAYECNTLLEKWRNPTGWKAVAVILFIALFIASVAVLVYMTGGTAFVWLHMMYIPIILAAASYRVLGGFAAALAGGLALGPFMPLHVFQGVSRSS